MMRLAAGRNAERQDPAGTGESLRLPMYPVTGLSTPVYSSRLQSPVKVHSLIVRVIPSAE